MSLGMDPKAPLGPELNPTQGTDREEEFPQYFLQGGVVLLTLLLRRAQPIPPTPR